MSKSNKHPSVDSGLGMADYGEHSDTIGSLSPPIMQSNGSAHNNNDTSISPTVTRPNSIPLSSVSSESDESYFEVSRTDKMGKCKFKDENREGAKTASPSSGTKGLIKESSITKDGVSVFNFGIIYCGDITLDKRITQPMLPWIIAEKRRVDKKQDQRILLQISGKGVTGISESQGLMLFHHLPTSISRFCRGHDKKSFGYLWRPDSESMFKCFIFCAADTEMIQNVHSAVKEASKDALMAEQSTHSDKEIAIESLRDNSATMYEVLYCGRVAVSHKRAPPSLIDDTIERFNQHELELQKKRLGSLRKRHYSAGDQDAPNIDDQPKTSIKTAQSEDKTSSSVMSSLSVDDRSISDSSHSLCSSSSISSADSAAVPANMFAGRDAFYHVVKEEMRLRAGSTGSSLVHKPRSESDSMTRSEHSETGHNRTMLFQIGKSMLTLISPDQKSFMLTKKYKDISFCSQGIQQPEYFGFICREKSSNSGYMCYVFKCESEAVVESIMGTLRQAFNTALANSRLHVICETCPMHQLHKLCEQIQGQSAEKVHGILSKQLYTMTEVQRDMIHNKLKLLKPSTQQEMNELVMGMLRAVCEEQQKTHMHIGEGGGGSSNNNSPCMGRKISSEKPPDSKFKKAKKSLASSFENLLNRSKSRTSTEKMEESEEDKTHDESGFANTGYSSRRNTMTEIDAQILVKELLKAQAESKLKAEPKNKAESKNKDETKIKNEAKNTTDSPIHTPRSDSPIPVNLAATATSTPSSITTSPTNLSCHSTEHHSRRIVRMSTEDMPLHYDVISPPPMRPRSKTVGDLPSPREGKVIDQIFATPKPPKSGAAVNKHRPLGRAMSFDERSPRTPKTPEYMTPSRRSSWRHNIFTRVVTPMAESRPAPSMRIVEEEEEEVFLNQKKIKQPLTPPRFTSKTSIRAMWRKAIMEQILLIRMERENSHLKARQDAAQEKRIKLNYEELNPCLIHATKEWERLLGTTKKAFGKIDEDEVNRLFKQGVPRSRRGDIWIFLVEQRKMRSQSIALALPHHDPYQELLKRLTTHQHSILIDLGRTFPTHAYFVNPLGRGQLSLFNLLKAFSLLDEEVGYCQGLSFVAGVLLMHMEEEDAFDILVYLMFGLGFRRQYRPDMTSLQIQMYQLERLLHDHHRRLHDHLQINDIAPSLYAAPWFLTIFASQFPLGFVSKVFDLIFLQGFEVIFKVALLILGIHEELLLACKGFEDTIEFLKNKLPDFGVVQMEKVINQAYNMDISKELHSYEVEYHIFQEEMIPHHNNASDLESLEKANKNLRRHNNQLLEQLQAAHNTLHNHDATISGLRPARYYQMSARQRRRRFASVRPSSSPQLTTVPEPDNEIALKSEIRNLNLEREALLNTVSKLQTLIPENVLQEAGINFTAPIFQKKSVTTNGTSSIGLSDLKRLNKEMKDTCIDEHDDDSKLSQRSSDSSSISNLSTDIDSPLYGNKP